MTLDIKDAFCVRIQPSNMADADFSVCSLAGVISSQPFCALKAGDKRWHEVFAQRRSNSR
jgi:hypothetical protein